MKTKLTLMEHIAIKLGRLNEFSHFKHFQLWLSKKATGLLIKNLFGQRIYYENLTALLNLNPDRGVLLVGNHRTFFDCWLMMSFIYPNRAKWVKQISFPVRSDFFYDHPLGIFINFLFGLGAMYPPIFRNPEKSAWNKDAVQRIIRTLAKPGSLIGYHPEGKRNKGDDPYQLLPAKPGIGQIILEAQPIVIPFFINGIENTFWQNVKSKKPIIIVYGEPIDFSEILQKNPIASSMDISEHTLDAVRGLMSREKELRELFEEGKIGKEDPWWGMGKVV